MARIFRQFSTFAGVGFVATAVHYAILIGFVEIFAVSAVAAALAGYSAGGIISYCLNRRLTFKSNAPHEKTVLRFALVAFGGFGLTFFFMNFFVNSCGMPYIPAQATTTGLVMLWSYAVHRNYTFA